MTQKESAMETLLKELAATAKLVDWDVVTDAVTNAGDCYCDMLVGDCKRCVQVASLNQLAQALEALK